MWTALRQEIEKTRTEFHLQDSVKPVGLDEWREIEDKLYDNFATITSHRSRPTWIWERLKVESLGMATDGQPYQFLTRLVDTDTELFLFLNETVNERDKFWIYQGTIALIQKLIEETVGIDEVIIIDKKYNWILCITHHDSIVVGGQPMIDRLKSLRTELTVD
jgi:hypothetical protein